MSDQSKVIVDIFHDKSGDTWLDEWKQNKYRYTILSPVGSGAGSVAINEIQIVLGKDKTKRLACKEMRSDTDQAEDRAYEEVTVMYELFGNPCIVNIYGFIDETTSHRDTLSIFMELCHCNLRESWRKRNKDGKHPALD
eukprot:704224_1